MNINSYMEQNISTIARTASRFYLKNKNGRRFISNFISSLHTSGKIRNEYEDKGIHIPPFLIASIASKCNLSCAGCYARAGGLCGDKTTAKQMNIADWEKVFSEASQLGISFILLAGGEPLLRHDIIEMAMKFSNMAFPIFTNGTLIDDDYIEIFDLQRNLIPVLSIEGSSHETDLRRGDGISVKLENVMEQLKKRSILFGVSITVTTSNLNTVTCEDYVSDLQKKGCGVVFYVEYVPVENGTESLVLSEDDVALLDEKTKKLKSEYKNISIISFPGDEKYMGGCLAAGRGFFHINPSGGAEPCPFSPHSAMNLKEHSIIEVLQSPFFKETQKISRNSEHKGGCTLFLHNKKVEASK